MEQVLSVEEKARRYDEAVINGSRLWESDIISRESYEYIFPELAESEDEKIRKDIINLIYWLKGNPSLCSQYYKDRYDGMLAWLEKQGEQKSLDGVTKEITKNKETAMSFLKSCGIMNANGELADEYKIELGKQKVEPKFKVGDWITDNTSTFQIVRVENEWYYADDGDKICFDVAHQYYHLWTIQEAETGDVLVHNGCTFIFMGIKDGIVQAIDEIMLEPVSFGEPDKDNDYHPATEEQCDRLEKALADAGYEWDSEKKELKKIESKFKVGDWVVDEVTGSVYQIKNCIENTSNHKYGYDLTNGGYIGSSVANHFHLWSIQDVKDGDILETKDAVFTFKRYEWDGEKKELKKVVVPIFNIGDTIIKKHNSDIYDFGSFVITDIIGGKYWYNNSIICDITEQDEWEIYEPVRQNPTWSEEDENRLLLLEALCDDQINSSTTYSTMYREMHETKDWLKSLKQRIFN